MYILLFFSPLKMTHQKDGKTIIIASRRAFSLSVVKRISPSLSHPPSFFHIALASFNYRARHQIFITKFLSRAKLRRLGGSRFNFQVHERDAPGRFGGGEPEENRRSSSRERSRRVQRPTSESRSVKWRRRCTHLCATSFSFSLADYHVFSSLWRNLFEIFFSWFCFESTVQKTTNICCVICSNYSNEYLLSSRPRVKNFHLVRHFKWSLWWN